MVPRDEPPYLMSMGSRPNTHDHDHKAVSSAAAADDLRIISRLSMDYVVSIYSAILRGSGHDPIDALLLSVVAVANVAHLNADKTQSRDFADISTPEPMDIKRPISRNAVALSLCLPYETVRRRSQNLIANGALVEIEGGLVGANEQSNPAMVRAMA